MVSPRHNALQEILCDVQHRAAEVCVATRLVKHDALMGTRVVPTCQTGDSVSHRTRAKRSDKFVIKKSARVGNNQIHCDSHSAWPKASWRPSALPPLIAVFPPLRAPSGVSSLACWVGWSIRGCSASTAPSSRLRWTSPWAKRGQARLSHPCTGHWPSQGLVGSHLLEALLARPGVRMRRGKRRLRWPPR